MFEVQVPTHNTCRRRLWRRRFRTSYRFAAPSASTNDTAATIAAGQGIPRARNNALSNKPGEGPPGSSLRLKPVRGDLSNRSTRLNGCANTPPPGGWRSSRTMRCTCPIDLTGRFPRCLALSLVSQSHSLGYFATRTQGRACRALRSVSRGLLSRCGFRCERNQRIRRGVVRLSLRWKCPAQWSGILCLLPSGWRD